MAVGGNDDTLASSIPASTTPGSEIAELVADRYRVVRWLGGGGMGRVYEVIDTELNERVALKVLRAGLSEEAIERFRREVRLTRRVQHRNVARMFDIGDHDGDKFLTMELIEGEPLTREIGPPMPWPRLQQLAIQICEGLAAAHRAGVVHRDLKPDNVLVERSTDRAVLTDFGIARSGDDAAVTQAGAVVGTPRYMAPEQLAAREVDARADLFSLGVILYELASGTRPWPGDNAITIAVAQATQPARRLVSSRLPPAFTALVMQCLEVDAAARPASAAELAGAIAAATSELADSGVHLPRVRTTTPPRPFATGVSTGVTTGVSAVPGPAPETAIAVLPFACAAGDEYLADGVSDDLTDTLSSTATLRVRPSGIVRSRTDHDPRELGRQLGVDHIIIGSLRRTPSGLRVSARLIGVEDGFQIWAHRADCTEAEVLAIAETLGRGIANALSTRATSATRPTDPRAVELYLRARAELRRFWGSHAEVASELLEQAAEISPGSGPIVGTLAMATVHAWVMQASPALFERAKRAINNGVTAGHPEAYLASAQFKFNTGDPVGGAQDLGIALVRAPMLGQAHELAAKILVEIGAPSDARNHYNTAMALDPTRAAIVSMDLARLDALEGWWERADRTIAAMIEDRDQSLAQLGSVFQARLAGWRGDKQAMLFAAQRFAGRMGGHSRLVELISNTAVDGAVDPAMSRSLSDAFGGPDRPRRGHLMGLQLLAEMSLMVGNHAAALDSLEAADQLGFLDIFVLDRCPLFDRVADEPRFRALRERVGARAAGVLAAFRTATG